MLIWIPGTIVDLDTLK